MELHLEMPETGSRRRLQELHRQLKAAIIDGRLTEGLRLPTSRELSASLGVSRNTVVSAYDLLLSEGYIEARGRAGTYVARMHRDPPGRTRAPRARPAPVAATPPEAPVRYDFRVGEPDQSLFPFDTWRRLSARALREFQRKPVLAAALEGERALREAIAGHVSFARAVACTADDVIVTAGAKHAFALLTQALVLPQGLPVALEDPGYHQLERILAHHGVCPAKVPVDAHGLVVDRLPPRTRAIFVTPSHQFPLGLVMSLARRLELLDFARRNDCLVVEDDYDAEFRYGGRPLDALQTLDRHGRVFYVGTFSKSLFPALRTGYIVAPSWARQRILDMVDGGGASVPLLTQSTLAAFIREGHLARHVRKMRSVYAERREAMLTALHQHGRGLLEPIGSEAGLHVCVRLASSRAPAVLAEAARQAGIALERNHAPGTLLLGLGGTTALSTTAGIKALCAVLRKMA
ncbi:MAG TPA: PLP-dependent aminotransferase family protein [Telluria sp.]|nr:PLP-dependent aminotransferase family protein [Telluria sp.]